MPKMSSKDAIFHATQEIFNAIKNTEPSRPLVKLGNGHKEAFRTLQEIFRKANPPEVPPRVTVMEIVQEKLKEVNQEISQRKGASQ